MIHRVTDLAEPLLVLYRSVADPDLARSHGLFVAEGRLVVRRVLEDPRYRLHSLLVNDAAYRDLEPELERLVAVAPVHVCRTEDFQTITGFNLHRGCLALVERPAPLGVSDLIAAGQRLIVLEGVSNADNVGGIFRNAAAFGADGVLLSPDSCDPLYRKAIRTSMAAVLRVPFARSEEWTADLQRVRAAGLTLVAFTPDERAEPIDAFAARAAGWRLALAFGAEGAGLSPVMLSAADASVRIPVTRDVDSLNVAVAAGIALYRLRP